MESATANTLFHKVKFRLRKASFIVFEMTATSKSMVHIQIGQRYGISQTTTWFFMQKVRDTMQSSEQHLLIGRVHVDELVVGGKEDGKQGCRDNHRRMAGLQPIARKYGIKQVPIHKRKFFKELHRSIPSQISKKHVQAYFDEFYYRKSTMG